MYGLIAAFTPLSVSDTCYKFQCRGIKNICPATRIGYIYFAMGGCNSIGFTGKSFGCAVACQFLIRPQWITCRSSLGRLLYYSFR